VIDLTRVTVTPENEKEVMETVDDLFVYHKWTDAQIAAGITIRTDLAISYLNILRFVPPCLTRTRALNAVLDARMLANAAITHKGKY
jgi:hypothetical protein